jgi:hypothetical protein
MLPAPIEIHTVVNSTNKRITIQASKGCCDSCGTILVEELVEITCLLITEHLQDKIVTIR